MLPKTKKKRDRAVINTKTLKKYLTADKRKLLKGQRYRFVDRGANILVVAHCDTVLRPPRRKDIVVKNRVLHSPCLDDRLGVYIALCVLPHLGIKADVLLTDDEEIGASTAQLFKPTKMYNWICELDRAGTDVVTYGMDSTRWLEALTNAGWEVGWGSFSDICFLDADACMMNLGIGYYNAHKQDSFVNLKETETQLTKFVEFYTVNKDTQYIQNPEARAFSYYDDLYPSAYQDDEVYNAYEERYWTRKLWGNTTYDDVYDEWEDFEDIIDEVEILGHDHEEKPLMFFCPDCYNSSDPEVVQDPTLLDYYIRCPYCGAKTDRYVTKHEALLHETHLGIEC